MFEIQKSGDKTSSGEIGLDIKCNIESLRGDTVTKLELLVHLRIAQTSLTPHVPGDGTGSKCRT